MKKRIALVLLALVMVLSMVACGAGNNNESEEVTLRWVGAGWSQNDKATKIIEKWNAQHPDVKVE
jgi:ABC-type glycerol-3-phosphate transport system substrate-binding protein